LSNEQCLTLACLLEVSAVKPGNVHRAADFCDMTFVDFLASSVAATPVLAAASELGVGPAVLQAVQATRRLTRSNTNLGTLLLLAPLAAVPPHQALQPGVREVLARLTPVDSRAVYEAIRLARPGGLGESPSLDVLRCEAPADLLEAMRLAATRDTIARQYVNDFNDIFELVVPALRAAQDQWPLGLAIVHTQLTLMQWIPDTLIARKCGPTVAQAAADRAAWVLEAGHPTDETFQDRLAEFDFWLRCDGHRRNPGTTADLIAAALYVALRQQWLHLPLRWSTAPR
jgi:triphosphoribosyl-dephospho-CoA synthase